MFYFFYIRSVIYPFSLFFFFNDTATTEIYTLSLHDALPIYISSAVTSLTPPNSSVYSGTKGAIDAITGVLAQERSEEHTSELQSRFDLVCRLLLEKKKINVRTFLLCFRYQTCTACLPPGIFR